jgi:hypothetical protein
VTRDSINPENGETSMHRVAVAALAMGLVLCPAGACFAREDGSAIIAMNAVPDGSDATGVLASTIRRAMQRVPIVDVDYDGVVTSAEASAFLERSFAYLDRNRDGALSKQEVVAKDGGAGMSARGMRAFAGGRAPEFDDVDLDGDGALSREEFIRAGVPGRPGRSLPSPQERRLVVFQALDADADGLVEREQFLSFGLRHFAASDRDGDGKVPIWLFLSRLGF